MRCPPCRSCSGDNTIDFPRSRFVRRRPARPRAMPRVRSIIRRRTLYVVATPIGNLADITLRALHVLQLVDAVACEDTRHTQGLLRAYGIDRPGRAAAGRAPAQREPRPRRRVIARLAQGERIAYVSDAGTPGVSDPGARLVAAVREAGHRVLPLPGASSVTTLVGAAGLVGAGDDGQRLRVRRLPAEQGRRARRRRAACWRDEPRAVRAARGAASHRGAGPRAGQCWARAGSPSGASSPSSSRRSRPSPPPPCPSWFAAGRDRTRGEFALVLHPVRRRRTTTASRANACCACCWPNCR